MNDDWSFFTAVYGKSPSDGIGGMVKEKVVNERLSRRRNTPILNAKDAFRYCNENTSEIDLSYAPPNEVVLARDDLQKRFEKGSFVLDTKKFFFFKCCWLHQLQTNFKRLSFLWDLEFFLQQ